MAKKFQTFIESKLKDLKEREDPLAIPFQYVNVKNARLECVTHEHLHDKELIHALTEWREKSAWFFPSQFTVTVEGTEKWLLHQLLQKKDRILFLIKIEDTTVGHMGLYTFNYSEESCEIDNVVRGLSEYPGIMSNALAALISWTFSDLKIKNLYLRVFEDNPRAIALYERLGFVTVRRIPLVKHISDTMTSWEESDSIKKAERYFILMKYRK
jgi:RimJ/RimL family protein N-acetyltransferase